MTDSSPPPRALAIVGPTGSGKSRLGVFVAQRLGLPVLCCDSVQVYRGLDIGSAKPDRETQAAVPHRLLDLVAPDHPFSAGDYATAALAELGHGPGLFVGGTGLYLRQTAWTPSGKAADDEASDPGRVAFITEWEDRDRATPGVAHAALVERDPATAATIHPRNVVRAVRALWLCHVHGQPVSQVRIADPPRPRVDLALVVLDPPAEALARAIDDRCQAMLRAGFLDEVEMLRRAGYSARHKAMRSLGYRQLLDHLEGHHTLAEALTAMQTATRHYARRQRTYFRHQFAAVAGPRITVPTPMWSPDSNLTQETDRWLPRLIPFLAGAPS